MYGSSQRQIRHFYGAMGIPATMTLIAANVVTFFLVAGLPQLGVARWLAFYTHQWPAFFWTPVTWPLVAAREDPLGLLFGAGWAYLFAGSLERSWGTRVFATFLVSVSALSALTTWLGGQVVGHGMLAGIWVAIGPAAVAWSIINASETINLFFLPVPAPVLGVLGAAMVWYHGGNGNPVLGLFALSGCAAAFWYARHGRHAHRGYAVRRAAEQFGKSAQRPGSGSPPLRFRDFDRDPPVSRGFDPLRTFRAWRQRRQLEKLWKRSGFSDPDEKNTRR